MTQRLQALEHWLKTECQLVDYQLVPIPGDASFRCYFRVVHAAGSYIVMDAPPEKERCESFMAIANALGALKLRVPKIYASDLQQGFLLLTDLGDALYLKMLDAANAEMLYSHALGALRVLQSCQMTVPLFTADFMYQELQLFKEWFLERHLSLQLTTETENLLKNVFQFLVVSAASQPKVFMHRDYHSANLMVLPASEVGILDFQDAFIGPVTYDLVSLLRDCYIDWPDALVTKLVLQYRERISDVIQVSDEQFIRWFDLMGMQRHLKALLTFSRKYHRDGNPHYLQHIPRTLNYVVTVSQRYPECQAFHAFLEAIVMPTLQKVSIICAP